MVRWTKIKSILATILCLAMFGSAASADLPGQVLRSMGLPRVVGTEATQVETIQSNLSWIGLYQGQITGRDNAETRDAITLFQTGLSEPATGSLSATQLVELDRRADAMRESAEFRTEDQTWTGSRFQLPRSFFYAPEISSGNPLNLTYIGRDVASTTLFLQRYDATRGASAWLNSAMENWASEGSLQVMARGQQGRFVYIMALNPETQRRTYSVFEVSDSEARGIDISIDEEHVAIMRPVIAEILGRVEFFVGPGVNRNSVQSRIRTGDFPGGQGQPNWMRTMIANGSGSIVSNQGHVLTNYHVVVGCERMTVNGFNAVLVGSDNRVDLALLRVPGLEGRRPVRFSTAPVRLGDEVLVLGYPVFNISPSMNTTYGIVSSTVGFRGDRSRIQITAPVQPGNSGGPVLTPSGHQIAVVASKPSAAAQVERNIENIGWVIRADEAVSFLRRFGVLPIVAADRRATQTDTPLSEGILEYRRLTIRVECHGD